MTAQEVDEFNIKIILKVSAVFFSSVQMNEIIRAKLEEALDQDHGLGQIAKNETVYVINNYDVANIAASLTVKAWADAVIKETSSLLDKSRQKFVSARNVCSGINDMSEHARRTTEHIIFYNNAFIDRDVVLYFHITPYRYSSTHKGVLPQDTSIANDNTRHQMAEMPDFSSFSNRTIIIYYRSLMHIECRFPTPQCNRLPTFL